MFSVIYSFTIYREKATAFEKAWRDMTLLIRKYEGGLGSRLHKQTDIRYIAYAQWPDRETWEKSGSKLPESADEIRKMMRESCEKIETIYELTVVDDLLV